MISTAKWMIILCLLSSCFCFTRFKHLRNRLHHQHEYSPIDYHWMTQKLDHFDPQNKATWNQKFLINPTYWGGEGYPIFILLGGEGPMTNDSVTTHFVLPEYAKMFSALIVSAEHRFYGDSIPNNDLSTNNLRYLSSEQALADFAALVYFIKDTYKTKNSKVISFGGSYSGALSAWFRLKYPHVVHAALASSSPVYATVDYPEYLEVVSQSLSTINNCNATVKAATDYYSSLIKSSEGRKKIVQDFKTCSPLENDLDIVTFFEFLADTISGFVQYNNDNNNYFPFNMDKMCHIFSSGTIDQTFPQFIAEWNKFSGSTCSDSSYTSDLAELMNTDPKSPGAAGRSWTYQTCTEFGYFQTSESIFSPFSNNISLDFFVNMCEEAFGVSKVDVQSNIAWTNEFYGGKDISSSRIMFTNGMIDPWHVLGIKSTTQTMPAVLMEGTAHCADLYPPTPQDLPTLTATRQIFVQYLGMWLSEN